MRSGRCHIVGMAKKPSRPRDPNQLAKLITDIATGDAEEVKAEPKDEAAAAKGRKAAPSDHRHLVPKDVARLLKSGIEMVGGYTVAGSATNKAVSASKVAFDSVGAREVVAHSAQKAGQSASPHRTSLLAAAFTQS